jgi:anti-anti-sigma factor
MEISLSMTDGIPVYHLTGRLDILSSPQLEERLTPLAEEQCRGVVFDCAGLMYVSSAGLRVFLTSQRLLKAKGGGIVFTHLNPAVKDLFSLSGLADLFIEEPSVEAAAARLTKVS